MMELRAVVALMKDPYLALLFVGESHVASNHVSNQCTGKIREKESIYTALQPHGHIMIAGGIYVQQHLLTFSLSQVVGLTVVRGVFNQPTSPRKRDEQLVLR